MAESLSEEDAEFFSVMPGAAFKTVRLNLGLSNPSGINPVEYNVLVEPKAVEAVTKGGLHLPDEVVEKDSFARMEGVLIAVSPLAFNFDDWPAESLKPQVGDRVMFSRYNGSEVKGRDGKTYWLMKDRSIAAVMADD